MSLGSSPTDPKVQFDAWISNGRSNKWPRIKWWAGGLLQSTVQILSYSPFRHFHPQHCISSLLLSSSLIQNINSRSVFKYSSSLISHATIPCEKVLAGRKSYLMKTLRHMHPDLDGIFFKLCYVSWEWTDQGPHRWYKSRDSFYTSNPK